MPSKSETLVVIVSCAAFLAFQSLVVGLIPAQVLMVSLFLVLFFAHGQTRRLAVALLPFVAFEMCYDWMRLLPNYRVNPIDVRGLYEAELSLFGIPADVTSAAAAAASGDVQTLCEYFAVHNCAVADVLAGFFYLCWVPGPMAVGLWLYFTGRRRLYLRFALAFLVVNLVGFAIYYAHPAAPPWYVLEHGFEPILGTPGSTAGLGRFDALVGFPVFGSIYVNNSNIFAAVPSLHAAYMLVATIYAMRAVRSSRPTSHRSSFTAYVSPLTIVCVIVTIGIWWTAVYSCHHYIIDVLLGIATALFGILLFERVLLRWAPFRRFFHRYAHYITTS